MTLPQKDEQLNRKHVQQQILELTDQLKNLSESEVNALKPQLDELHRCLGNYPARVAAPKTAQWGTGNLTRQLLETIFTADPGGLAVVTTDDRVFQMVNQAYRSLTPNPVVDPLGKRMDEIWTAEDIRYTIQAFQQVTESKQSLKADYPRTYEDGEIRYFTAHLVPLDWTGRPAVLIVLWETTDLQRTQQYLVESEERFRLALAHMPDLFVIYDPDRRIQFVSDITLLPGDRPMQDFIGRRDEEIWPESVTSQFVPQLIHTYTSKQTQRFEMSTTLTNGRTFAWAVTYVPVLNEDGEIRQLIGIYQDITERKRAETELLASQQALVTERNRLLAVLDALPVGVSILDENGGLIQANQGFEAVWSGSLPPTTVIEDYAAYQAWWAETGQPVLPEEWASALAVRTGKTVRDQFLRIRCFDGTYKYVLNSSAPIRSSDGRITGATVAIMDVSARVEAEEAVRASEHALRESEAVQREIASRFEVMANNIPQLAWMTDASGWIFWYNQRWYEYTGATFEAMEGWGWQKVHHPDYVDAVTKKFREHIALGDVWEDTFPLRGKDGQYRWFLSRAIPIHDAAGNVTRWFGTNTDITAQRESQERFRVALANAPLLVYTCDRDQRYTWVYNPLRGFKAEDVLGKRDDEVLPLEAAADLVAAKQRALDTGKGTVQEVQVLLGEEITYYILTTEPIKDPDGLVTGLTCSAIDITEQRRLAEEKREQRTQVEVQRRLLEYREKERQEIARDLHDGPIQLLAGTIFHLQVAREATQDALMKIELEQAALNIKAAVRDLRETVNELRPPALLRFGLTKSAKMHAEDFRERHPELKLTLNMIDDKGLLSEQACLALFRIFQEALNNVVKHANASRVWVRFTHKDHQVRLEIRDNGKGVSMADTLAEQTNKGHFGVAGMQERAQAVGGTLKILSETGKGTRIVVVVPIEK